MSTATPRWLTERIAENSRRAKAKTCPRCGTPVFAGLNGDWCAWPVVIDAAPVTHIEAVASYLADETTVHGLIHGEIHLLFDLHLAGRGPAYPLHLTHHCPRGES